MSTSAITFLFWLVGKKYESTYVCCAMKVHFFVLTSSFIVKSVLLNPQIITMRKKKEKNCGSFLITNAKKNYSDFKFPYYFHQFHHNQKQKSAKHCHLCSGTLGSMIMLDHQRSHNNNSTGMSQAH